MRTKAIKLLSMLLTIATLITAMPVLAYADNTAAKDKTSEIAGISTKQTEMTESVKEETIEEVTEAVNKAAKDETKEAAAEEMTEKTAEETEVTTEVTTEETTEITEATTEITETTDTDETVETTEADLDKKNQALETEEKVITDFTLKGLITPVPGKKPVNKIIESEQYTGTVIYVNRWYKEKPVDRFQCNSQYIACVTLTPKKGYTMKGVGANAFKVDGAPQGTEVTNWANNTSITVLYPKTGVRMYEVLIDNKVYTLGETSLPEHITYDDKKNCLILDGFSGQAIINEEYDSDLILYIKGHNKLTGLGYRAEYQRVVLLCNEGNINISGDADGVLDLDARGQEFPQYCMVETDDLYDMDEFKLEGGTVNLMADGDGSYVTGIRSASTKVLNDASLNMNISNKDDEGDSTCISGNLYSSTSGQVSLSAKGVNGYAVNGKAQLSGNGVFYAEGSAAVDKSDKGVEVPQDAQVYGDFSKQAYSCNMKPESRKQITDFSFEIQKPVLKNNPESFIKENEQYTGYITWTESDTQTPPVVFKSQKIYTANVTLVPKPGYTMSGIGENVFSVQDSKSVYNRSSGNQVKVVYEKTEQTTDKKITDLVIRQLPVPIPGEGAQSYNLSTETYTGNFIYRKGENRTNYFDCNEVFTAVVTLTPKQGYTFEGVSADSFTVEGAPEGTVVKNLADTGVVYVTYPATDNRMHHIMIDNVRYYLGRDKLPEHITYDEQENELIVDGFSGTSINNRSDYSQLNIRFKGKNKFESSYYSPISANNADINIRADDDAQIDIHVKNNTEVYSIPAIKQGLNSKDMEGYFAEINGGTWTINCEKTIEDGFATGFQGNRLILSGNTSFSVTTSNTYWNHPEEWCIRGSLDCQTSGKVSLNAKGRLGIAVSEKTYINGTGSLSARGSQYAFSEEPVTSTHIATKGKWNEQYSLYECFNQFYDIKGMDVTYNGKVQAPDIRAKSGKQIGAVTMQFYLDSDYTKKTENPTKAGEYYVLLHNAGGRSLRESNYRAGKFTIHKVQVPVPDAKNNLVYNGTKQTILEKSPYYSIKDNDGMATNAGTYYFDVLLADNENYEWLLEDGTSSSQTQIQVHGRINRAPGKLTSLVVLKSYDGTNVTKDNIYYSPSDRDGTKTVKWYKDDQGVRGSELKGESIPKECGSYWAGISFGSGKNYLACEETFVRFDIAKAYELSSGVKVFLPGDGSYLYTGYALKPQITVYAGTTKLTANRDYTVTYYNNMNVANASSMDGEKEPVSGPYMIIRGRGKYKNSNDVFKGKIYVPFTIRQADLSEIEDITVKEPGVMTVLSGNRKQALPVRILQGRRTLKNGKDYTVSLMYRPTKNDEYMAADAITKAGEYQYSIQGTGCYKGSLTGTVQVTDKKNMVSAAQIRQKVRSMPYTTAQSLDSNEKTQEATAESISQMLLSIRDGKREYEYSTDADIEQFMRKFKVSIPKKEQIEIGRMEVTITGRGEDTVINEGDTDTKFYGSTSFWINVTGTTLISRAFYLSCDKEEYSGKPVNVKLYCTNTYPYTEGTDYRVDVYRGKEKINSINEIKDAGLYTIVVQGMGAYKGKVSKNFRVLPATLSAAGKNTLANISVTVDEAVYEKTGVKPSTHITYLGKDLEIASDDILLSEGKDYRIQYQNNKRTGDNTARVIVNGCGNFKGQVRNAASYTIRQGDFNKACLRDAYSLSGSGIEVVVEDVAYRENNKTGLYQPKVTVYDNGTRLSASEYTVLQSDVKVDLEDQGLKTKGYAERIIRITPKKDRNGNSSYKNYKAVVFRVYKQDLRKAVVETTERTYYYQNGQEICPSVIVRIADKEEDGGYYTLNASTDYQVVYQKNNNIGMGRIVIIGKGKYGGTCVKSFRILPGILKNIWKN